MVGSLSLFSPGSIQSYGASSATLATPQSRANDGSAACASLDCGEHGALNRATLQAQFPGLSLAAAAQARQTQQQQQQQSGFGPKRQTSDAPASGGGGAGLGSIATGGGRLASATLLTAQEAGQGGSAGAAANDLSEEEQAQVAKLKQIDAKVRAHERAHAAVGGAHAGAPSYTYTRGPDGQMYATGGEVAIDISAESDPEATLQKATQVAAAALAPADPSGQDRAVAAAASQLRLEALAQIREEKRAEQEQQQAEAAEAKAEREQSEAGGEAPGSTPASAPGSSPVPGQASAAAAHQQIGRLVGLVA